MNVENILLVFGTFFYILTALISSYIACVGQIEKHVTTKLGELIVYYGAFNIVYWAIIILTLVTRKVGMVLLS